MIPERDPALRAPWRVRDAVWAILAGLAASLVALMTLGGTVSVTELFAVVIPVQSLTTVLVVGILAPVKADWRRELRATMRLEDLWGLLIGAVVQILLSLAAYWVIVELFDGAAPTQEIVDAASSAIGGLDRILVVLGLVVLGPVSEEVVFRGILVRVLERSRGRRYAVIVSALAFAALHLLDPNAVVAVPFLFVLGLVLARQVLDTGRLGRSIAIHAGFNLVTVLALFAA